MMTTEPRQPAPTPSTSRWKVAGLILLTVLLSVGITLWLVFAVLFPTEFKPVTLNEKEALVLEQKLARLDPTTYPTARGSRPAPDDGQAALTPEPYSEADADREIALTEKELNALLATNTDLAHRLAIDLADNLASAKLLVPLDPEFPLIGGKTLKLTGGMEMRFANGRPVIILKGISVWGVPLPNAWLGNMKNIDLVQEFGADQGFWQAFSEGVEEVEVKEGKLRIKLKE
jgi:hypothetical protein